LCEFIEKKRTWENEQKKEYLTNIRHLKQFLKGKNQFELLEIKKGSTETNFTEVITLNGKDLSGFEVVTKGAYSLLMQLKNTSE
jgi:hypothetical protein